MRILGDSKSKAGKNLIWRAKCGFIRDDSFLMFLPNLVV